MPSVTEASIDGGTSESSISACSTPPRTSASSRPKPSRSRTLSSLSRLLTPCTRLAAFAASRFSRKLPTVPRSLTSPSSVETAIASLSTRGSQKSSSSTSKRSSSLDMMSSCGSWVGPAWRARRQAGSPGFVDPDLVGDAGDAMQARDPVEGLVALVLEAELALEGDRAVVDRDPDGVPRDLAAPLQPLQRGAADLGVLAPVAVEQSHLQPLVDVPDALGALRVGDGGVPLSEAAHGPAQRRDAVDDLDGDLAWIRDAGVAGDLGARVVFDLAAGGVHARDARAGPARR